ncbi:24366_t:CDS:2 [Dentiscutata erythropus]|uniref:24366_t:CDS:1 n=1 Tax=Dentiscutata erythropus TaxID=1348616 RepID=A0A9N9AVN5_9GLOM|nr:24366_t:CDS:2 [Dentiscutata erythropus]
MNLHPLHKRAYFSPGPMDPGNQPSLTSRLTLRSTSPTTVLEPEKQPSLHSQVNYTGPKELACGTQSPTSSPSSQTSSNIKKAYCN